MKTSTENPIIKFMKKGWGIFLGYSLLSILMTYPMIFRLNYFPYTGIERIPPGGDSYYYLWWMWWCKKAILGSHNLFWTNYIFYPQGASLYFNPTLLYAIISIPFQGFFELATIYNILYLFSLVISGIGAYLLLKYLTKSRLASFIVGCIFAFAPFHFVHIGHLPVSSYQWLPFFVLFFIRMYKESSYKNALFAAVFWTISSYGDYNYGAMLLVFILFFFVYQLWYNRKTVLNSKFLKRFAVMSFLFFILMSPVAIPMVKLYFQGVIEVVRPIQSSISQSADFLSYFVPSFMHPVFGKLVEPFYRRVATFDGYKISGYVELVTYIGFTVIFLVIYALRRISFDKIRFWLFLTIIFFILSLGPALKFNGLVTFPAGGLRLDKIAEKVEPNLNPIALGMLKKYIGIPLPYLIWHFTPILNGAESASRLFVLVLLGVTVLSGYTCRDLLERLGKRRLFHIKLQVVLASLLISAVMFEFLSIPIPMVYTPIPSFYKQISQDSADYCVIDVPLLSYFDKNDPFYPRGKKVPFYSIDSGLSQYYQTVHNKRILVGLLARWPEGLDGFIEQTPFLKLLAHPNEIEKNNFEVSTEILEKYHMKYIVLYKQRLSEKEFSNLTIFLDSKFNKPVFIDEGIVVYQVY